MRRVLDEIKSRLLLAASMVIAVTWVLLRRAYVIMRRRKES